MSGDRPASSQYQASAFALGNGNAQNDCQEENRWEKKNKLKMHK